MNVQRTIAPGLPRKARVPSPAGHVLVVGLGETGLSCIRHLAGPHRRVREIPKIVAVDSREHPPCRAAVESEFPETDVRCGGFDARTFATAAEIVVSPGVSVREPALRAAAARGVPIVGDVELFARAADAPVVAITGSNGKSTVTSLVAAMAERDGVRVGGGGNLGPPALSLLGRGHELYVLELSSFQLETTSGLRPAAATVLNVSADHMDRYESFDAYVAAKSRVLGPGAVVITNLDDPRAARLGGDRCERIGFSTRPRPGARWYVEGGGSGARIMRRGAPVMPVEAVPLPGMHNVANVLAAFALGDAIGLRPDAMSAAVEAYAGLPHRCETVAVAGGVRWIDDSKGTNVGAAVAAIEGIGAHGPVVLIAGGIAKGADFSPLRAPAGRHVRCAVLIGRDAGALEEALGPCTEVRRAPDLAAAVDVASAVGARRRQRAALPRLRELRHVRGLRGARRGVPAACAREGRRMSETSGSQALPRELAVDRTAFAYRHDVALIAVVAALLGIGLVMVASASTSIAARAHGDPLAHLWRQSLHVAVAVAALVAAARCPVRLWERAGPVLMLASVALLALVLVPGVGREVNGSTRWIGIGGLNLQPSELAKLCFVIYLAGDVVRREEKIRLARFGVLRPLTALVVVSVLLLCEPDHGAVFVLSATVFTMLFLAGLPIARYAVLAGAAAAALAAAILLGKGYVILRLTSFIDPFADPYGSGFQLAQSLIAIGRGGWFGVGLGEGVQKLFYLPEAHTDFLFAVLAEEFGLVGTLTVVGLYTFIVLRSLSIGRKAEATGAWFAAYAAYGIGLLLGVHAFVNIGVNIGLLPTKGLTLPLMSYGGSNLVVSAASIGILLRIDHERRAARWGTAP